MACLLGCSLTLSPEKTTSESNLIGPINTADFKEIHNSLSMVEVVNIVWLSREDCDACIKATPTIEAVFQKLRDNHVPGNPLLVFHLYETDKHRNEEGYQQILEELGVEMVPGLIIYDGPNNRIDHIDDLEVLMSENSLFDLLSEYSSQKE